MHAYRCHACGHLDSASNAGECLHPHACRCCGAGVSYDPKTGVKVFNPENWEVLSNATPERLAELGITETEAHAPVVASTNAPKVLNIVTGNVLGITQRTQ